MKVDDLFDLSLCFQIDYRSINFQSPRCVDVRTVEPYAGERGRLLRRDRLFRKLMVETKRIAHLGVCVHLMTIDNFVAQCILSDIIRIFKCLVNFFDVPKPLPTFLRFRSIHQFAKNPLHGRALRDSELLGLKFRYHADVGPFEDFDCNCDFPQDQNYPDEELGYQDPHRIHVLPVLFISVFQCHV